MPDLQLLEIARAGIRHMAVGFRTFFFVVGEPFRIRRTIFFIQGRVRFPNKSRLTSEVNNDQPLKAKGFACLRYEEKH
jgi:hypothetical protein